jgi:membrane protein
MVVSISKETISGFLEEKAFFHGAALAYYALFSLIPLLYLGISIMGRIIGQDFILELISDFLKSRIGLTDIDEIMKMVGSYQLDQGNLFMEIIGFTILLFAGSAFLNSLKNSINDFYNIQKTRLKGKTAIKRGVVEKLLSLLFLGVFATIFLVIYLFHSIGFTAVQFIFNSNSQLYNMAIIIVDYGFSILLNYLIFLLIFKFLNNATVSWKVASMGAIVTSILLFFGQLIIKYYLLNLFILGTVGIAGSLFIFLAWVHYSSQIIFIGAKFTYTFSKRIGQPILIK